MESDALGDLELRRYARGLIRRKWMIAAVVLVALALSLGVSFVETPVYQATAQVVLEPSTGESVLNQPANTQLDPQVSVSTEVQVIESAPVQAAVEGKLGPVRKVSASQVGQTLVIEVKGFANTNARAAAVANGYASAYLDLSKQREVSGLNAAAQQLQGQITRLQSEINEVASATTDTASDVSSLIAQRDAFAQQLSQVQVDASLASGGARLVDQAIPPPKPIRPRPVRYALLAVLVGLVVGIAAAFVLEYLDDRIRTEEDLKRATGLPVLAAIPKFEGRSKAGGPALSLASGRTSPETEAYRALRTSTQFLGIAKPLTAIQFTSPSPGDGKTTTVANLAIAMADSGRRVVVVDSDLRRPRLHQVFGVSNGAGVTNVLSGEVALSEAVQPVPGRDGLFVLAGGARPPNPSELLSLNKMSQILFALQSEFEVVLLDSPPVLPVTDAVVLSEWVDGVVLVAAAGVSSRKAVAQTVDRLRQAEAPLVGAVLNQAVLDRVSQYGYPYGDPGSSRQRHRGHTVETMDEVSEPGVPGVSSNGSDATADPAPMDVQSGDVEITAGRRASRRA